MEGLQPWCNRQFAEHLVDSSSGLGDKLRIAMDVGAKRVMFPTENRRDFAELPPEVIGKLQIDLYGDPSQVAFKALTEINSRASPRQRA